MSTPSLPPACDSAPTETSPPSYPPFEGVEKRLIVRFSEALLQHPEAPFASLRDVPDADWSKMLEAAACTILSKCESEGGHLVTVKHKKKLRRNRHKMVCKRQLVDRGCTAYLLSESSLFVYDSKIIIKTCGTTTPLLCIDPLLDLVVPEKIRAAAGEDRAELAKAVCDLAVFSRLNYKFPERQRFPHRNFTEEVEYLNRYWPSGESFQLPTAVNRDFNVFLHASPAFIKVASAAHPESEATARCPVERDLDITEIMMLGVDETCVDHFAGRSTNTQEDAPPCVSTLPADQEAPESPQAAQAGASGSEGAGSSEEGSEGWEAKANNFAPQANTALKKMLPAVGTRLDQFWFSPFGYSCNAVSRSFFLNSHISPEPAASYASVETNYPFGHVSFDEYATTTLRCFKPTEVHIVQMRLSAAPFKDPHLPAEAAGDFRLKRLVDARGSWYKLSHAHFAKADDASEGAAALKAPLALLLGKHHQTTDLPPLDAPQPPRPRAKGKQPRQAGF